MSACNNNLHTMSYKVLLFGEPNAGKTTLLEKFRVDKRTRLDNEESCILLNSNGNLVSLWVRETHCFTEVEDYHPNAAIVMLCCDPETQQVDLRLIKTYIIRIKINYGIIPIIVCVNKVDRDFSCSWDPMGLNESFGWISCLQERNCENLFSQLYFNMGGDKNATLIKKVKL